MKKKILVMFSFIILIIGIVLTIIIINKNNKLNSITNNLDKGLVNNSSQSETREEIVDNSIIGTLTIPRINLKDINICEGVELETLAHSIGHFENTNIFEGNVGLASHNAGTKANYFADINKLQIGDEIYYKTKYGTKKYVVDNIIEIDSYDWSKLEYTELNKITLITCISGNTNLRLCVQGIEKN